MFLPSILMENAGKASIVDDTGVMRPLTGETHTYEGVSGISGENSPTLFTPLVVFTLLFALVAVFSIWEYRRGRHIRAPDYVIFGLYGLFGCVLFFLIFISIHPGHIAQLLGSVVPPVLMGHRFVRSIRPRQTHYDKAHVGIAARLCRNDHRHAFPAASLQSSIHSVGTHTGCAQYHMALDRTEERTIVVAGKRHRKPRERRNGRLPVI